MAVVDEAKLRYLDFLSREDRVRHHRYVEEMKQYDMMRSGDINAIAESTRLWDSGLYGYLSDDPLKNAKYRFVTTITLATRFAIEGGMDEEDAYNASDLSRLGGHNDCFGASADDYGTFDNETGDRNFWKHETRYTLMGGETCKVSNYCTCPASLKDLEDYHWTYLNSGYNSSVLNRWKNTGCMEEIENRLGYRLVLSEVSYPAKREAGKKTLVRIKFANKGFAAPMNPRMAMLAFVETKGKKINGEYVTTYIPLSDPRTWLPGEHEEEIPFTLPAEHGTMYMILDDPLLQGRPEYSIALANEGVWDAKTGWNKLFDL